MTVLTAFADTNDGYITSTNAAYLTARSGSTPTADNTATDMQIGQAKLTDYSVYETFLKFDTSSVGSGSTISTAVLSLFDVADLSSTDFTMEAWVNAWTAPLDSTDYVAGASISALTKVASIATSAWAANAYNALTDVAMPANVNKTGTTSLMVASSRTAAGTTPTGFEYISVASSDTSGTTSDPKLVVTYTLGGSFPPRILGMRQAVNRATSF